MRKLLALLAVCTAVVACDTRQGSSVTAPFSAELGTYTLQSVSGVALPYPLPPTAPGTTRKVIADTIVLTSGGNAREIYYTATTSTADSTTKVSSVALSGKYTITHDSITTPPEFAFLYGKYNTTSITFTDASGFAYLFARK